MILGAAATVAVAVTFGQGAAVAGDEVTVRASGLRGKQPVYLYVVARHDRAQVRSALDDRLVFAARLRPRSGRATATFDVPPTPSGDYVAWCRGCRARTAIPLRVTMPDATTTSCPVTTSRGEFYGHALLRTTLRPGGIREGRPEPDGSIFDKLPWIPARGVYGDLSLTGDRLDGPGRLRVLAVNWGHSSDGRGSWATAVEFPEPGCWKLRARLKPSFGSFSVDLAYVVKVVRG